MKQREEFEEWASRPPREWSTERFVGRGSVVWPGQYRDYHVQCAWEAWWESRGRTIMEQSE